MEIRHTPADDHTKRRQILEQILFFETRLQEMGWSGDCAYEKSLTRVYETQLQEKRALLSSLGN